MYSDLLKYQLLVKKKKKTIIFYVELVKPTDSGGIELFLFLSYPIYL